MKSRSNKISIWSVVICGLLLSTFVLLLFRPGSPFRNKQRIFVVAYLDVFSHSAYSKVASSNADAFTENLNRTLAPNAIARVMRTDVHLQDDGIARSQIGHSIDQKPDLVVALNLRAAELAYEMAPQQPVLFATGANPFTNGVLTEKAGVAPFTGLSFWHALHAKRLQLLHELAPGIRRVGVIVDEWIESSELNQPEIAQSISQVGLELSIIRIGNSDEYKKFKADVSSGKFNGVDGWYIPTSYAAFSHGEDLASLLKGTGHPTIWDDAKFVAKGGNVAYSVVRTGYISRLAYLASAILNGTDPRLIPVERGNRFSLVANKTPHPKFAPEAYRRLLLVADFVR